MDALADLQDILAEAQADPGFLAQLQADLHPFVSKVTSELNEDVPSLTLVREGRLAELVQQIAPALLAHLAGAEEAHAPEAA